MLGRSLTMARRIALLLCTFCAIGRVTAFLPVPALSLCRQAAPHALSRRLRSQPGTNKRERVKVCLGSAPGPAQEATGDVCWGVEPALAGLLLRAARNIRGFDVRSVADAAAGLRVWREMLQKGRLPMDEDFQAAGGPVWPTEPLFSRFVDVLAELQLPRFVMRHPDTSSAVLLRMLQLTIDFLEQTQFAETSDTLDSLADTGGGHADSDRGCSAHDPDGLEQQAGLEALADELTGEMVAEWAGVISGVHTLDQLFGMQHGLLDAGNRLQSLDQRPVERRPVLRLRVPR